MTSWVREAVKTLIEYYQVKWWGDDYTPFEILVATVLSQNTTDVNARRAFDRLKKAIGEVTPQRLLSTEESKLVEALRVAGLARVKAKRLRQISKEILERFGGDFDIVFSGDVDSVRQKLLSLPGVGPKTADVLLAFVKQASVIPIDTHIFTIAERWGIAPRRRSYEDVKKSLESLIPEEIRAAAHIALVEHGKRLCKARNPLCKRCPISGICPYPSTH